MSKKRRRGSEPCLYLREESSGQKEQQVQRP